MLHLAEVKKQPRGLMGGQKTEIKLLARQEKDQSWIPIPGEETVICEYVNNWGEGALVLVTLGSNRQIQGPLELAGPKLVRQLQNFSRLLEKNKSEDERIEMWKQSLTAQAEVLNQREEEISLLYEQIEAKEKDLEQLNEQRQEIQESWSRLKQEQDKLKQIKQKQLLVFNEEQSRKIKELTAQFGKNVEVNNALRENFNIVLQILNTKQSNLNYHWQQLEQQKQQAQAKSQEVDHLGEQTLSRRENLYRTQEEVEKAETDWRKEQMLLKSKEEYLTRVSEQLQLFNQMKNELNRIEAGDFQGEAQVDIEHLENMPLGELEKEVKKLEQDLQNTIAFVNSQEKELEYHSGNVLELQEKLKTASNDERIDLQGQLQDAQEEKNRADESLQGQRPKLRKKREILIEYLKVFKRRKGEIDLNSEQEKLKLQPLQIHLEEQQGELEQQKQKLEQDIDHVNQSINQTAEWLEQQKNAYKNLEKELETQEQIWQQQKVELQCIQLRVQMYEELLHPWQDSVNQMREKLQAVETLLNQIQENSHEQNRFGQELEQILQNLLNSVN